MPTCLAVMSMTASGLTLFCPYPSMGSNPSRDFRTNRDDPPSRLSPASELPPLRAKPLRRGQRGWLSQVKRADRHSILPRGTAF